MGLQPGLMGSSIGSQTLGGGLQLGQQPFGGQFQQTLQTLQFVPYQLQQLQQTQLIHHQQLQQLAQVVPAYLQQIQQTIQLIAQQIPSLLQAQGLAQSPWTGTMGYSLGLQSPLAPFAQPGQVM